MDGGIFPTKAGLRRELIRYLRIDALVRLGRRIAFRFFENSLGGSVLLAKRNKEVCQSSLTGTG